MTSSTAPSSTREADRHSRLRIIDCDVHPSLHAQSDLYQFLPKRWQEHLKTYGGHLRTPYIGTTPYPRSSPLIARRDAWPPTGGPPGSDLDFHAQAASRSARRRVRHPAGARPLHLLAAEPRIRRRDPARHQRLAAGVLVASRSAAEGVDPGRPGRHGAGDRRDRALRQDRRVYADQRLAARQRAARPPPLLADLRARAGAGPAARHPCRRLWRPCADRRRLAVLLLSRSTSATRIRWRRSWRASSSKAFRSAFRSSRSSSSKAASAGSRRRCGGWTSISSASAARCRISSAGRRNM